MSKALLVADASWVVNEVRSSLTLGEWEVEDISDPRLAADVAEQSGVDAVIVDMQVGSMGGMAVIRDIRQRLEGSDRPLTVLLLDRSADEFLAKRAGADAYVLKPISSAVLREALAPAHDTPGPVASQSEGPPARRAPARKPKAPPRDRSEEE
ncbi:MAG: response regulator [Acidimicrobiia bacterium]